MVGLYSQTLFFLYLFFLLNHDIYSASDSTPVDVDHDMHVVGPQCLLGKNPPTIDLRCRPILNNRAYVRPTCYFISDSEGVYNKSSFTKNVTQIFLIKKQLLLVYSLFSRIVIKGSDIYTAAGRKTDKARLESKPK